MLNPGIYHSLPKSIKLLAIHADENGKFDNESLWICCEKKLRGLAVKQNLLFNGKASA
jgi:hypothetical protein